MEDIIFLYIYLSSKNYRQTKKHEHYEEETFTQKVSVK